MESVSFLDLGKPKIKPIEISTQGSLGTSKGLYNTWGFTIDLACLQVMHLSQILCISLFMYANKNIHVKLLKS